MQLQMNWPSCGLRFPIPEAASRERAAIFCLTQHAYVDLPAPGSEGQITLWWEQQDLLINVQTETYVALIDGRLLSQGETCRLQLGQQLQIGMLAFTVIAVDEGIATFIGQSTKGNQLPELTELLNHGGYYSPWHSEVKSVTDSSDVLQSLRAEYKRYLLWGEQTQHYSSSPAHSESRLPEEDTYLEQMIDSVEDKTLAECILNSDKRLIERVITELMAIDYQEEPQPEPVDILNVLAPENFSSIARHQTSELLYRELYKLGLDSHL